MSHDKRPSSPFTLESPTSLDVRKDRIRRAVYPLRLASSKKKMKAHHDGWLTSTGCAFIRCIMHKERTPSMRIHIDNSVYCYGCGFQTTLDELDNAEAGRIAGQEEDV